MGVSLSQKANDELLDRLLGVARGDFETPTAAVEMLEPPAGAAMAIVGLAGCHLIATSAPEQWVRSRLSRAGLMGPLSPRFITEIGTLLGRYDDGIDMLFAAASSPGPADLIETRIDANPRIARAMRHREQVRTFRDRAGQATVSIGLGLAGRQEVSVEVSAAARNNGIGRRALAESRRLADSVIFAQAAPGNAASVRALLAAGFTPIGAEVLFFEGDRPTD